MQTTRVWIFVVVCFVIGGVKAELDNDLKANVDQLVSSLRRNFGQLNGKRAQWFANHHKMETTLEKDRDALKELLDNSRRAMPLIWTSYASRQALQRAGGEVLVSSGKAKLPVVADFFSKTRGFLLEVVLDTGMSAIEIQIVGDGRPYVLAVVRLVPDLRTLTLLDGPRDFVVERASMNSDDFPAPDAFEHPFKIGVQTWESCVFVTLWTGDLSFRTPRALPTKIHWCRPVGLESVAEGTLYTASIAFRHPDAGCHGDSEDDHEIFCSSKREPLEAVIGAKVYHRLVFG